MRLRSGTAVAVAQASGYSSIWTPNLGSTPYAMSMALKRQTDQKKKKTNNKLKILFFFGFCLSRVAAGSQARGLIRAVAAGLHHSHSNARSKPCL